MMQKLGPPPASANSKLGSSALPRKLQLHRNQIHGNFKVELIGSCTP